MKIRHHDLEIDLPEDWWDKAGMREFAPVGRAYPAKLGNFDGGTVLEIPIDAIGPVRRTLGVPYLKEDRALRILGWLRAGTKIERVRVEAAPAECLHKYKLKAGTHRLYCSLAAGFSHIPAVEYPPWT